MRRKVNHRVVKEAILQALTLYSMPATELADRVGETYGIVYQDLRELRDAGKVQTLRVQPLLWALTA